MKTKIVIHISLLFAFLSCKKDTNSPTSSQPISQTNYTYQYLTKSGPGAPTNDINWVIDGDTLSLGQCSGVYTAGDYYKSFNFEVGKEYDFKILRRFPATTNYEVKNVGTIKFIDGNGTTDVYGGISSVVITQGVTWTYQIMYAQCGSITNQLSVKVP